MVCRRTTPWGERCQKSLPDGPWYRGRWGLSGGLASGAAVPSNDLNAVLQEVVKVVAHQGKAIGDLTDAVRGLMTQRSNPGFEKPQKPKFKPRYTQDGQPICMRCEGVGHIARQCTTRRDQHGAVEASTDAHVQGNAIPPLL